MAIAVFISHSGHDEQAAAALARLLEQALELLRADIRCTSVPGYKLPPGVELRDVLRSDVAGAQAFIGLVTPASLKSDYVLFEMGARWRTFVSGYASIELRKSSRGSRTHTTVQTGLPC